jgi:type I restriction enzyme R subunit
MSFNECNTVEQMVLDALTSRSDGSEGRGSLGGGLRPPKWEYTPATEIPRQHGDVMVESWLRLALIRFNPEIAAQPANGLRVS